MSKQTNENKPENDLIDFNITKENDPIEIVTVAELTGRYIEQLQKKYHYSPVFPLKLLPMSKEKYKRWGFSYAKLKVKQNGELLQYQEEAALSFTRFRNMTDEQWEKIKTDSIEDLILYKIEKSSSGYSKIEIPDDIKDIMNSYLEEYEKEVKELHGFLRSSNKGCLGHLMIWSFLIIIIEIIFTTIV